VDIIDDITFSKSGQINLNNGKTVRQTIGKIVPDGMVFQETMQEYKA
jgi:hypothetical protein